MSSVFYDIKNPRPNTLTFRLSPVHVSYANTLRRLCMTHVKCVGFNSDIRDDGSTSDVKILANSTPMTNEMLAHRIGLLPIYEQKPLEWNPENYEFSLDITNDTNMVRDVTSSDILVREKKGDDYVAIPSSRFFKPNKITGDTPLIAVLKPLLPGGQAEEIRFTARATVGTGQSSARWIPTTQCTYSYSLDTDPEHQEVVFNEWLTRTKKIMDPASLKEKEPEKRKSLWKEFQTLEINRCYLKNEEGEPESFDFTIESAGVLSPVYIVEQACESAEIMCKQFAGESLPDSVTVDPADGNVRGWDFIFQGQDHTLGNCIQSWLDVNRVGQGEITFAGYDVPHPLHNEMVIRIGCVEEAGARRALREAMVACGSMFSVWKQSWRDAVGGPVVRTEPVSTLKKPRVIKRPGLKE
jgi:DNA-directed RNA polymerase subunit L/DNA-directed RNA polymerase alpha subunit